MCNFLAGVIHDKKKMHLKSVGAQDHALSNTEMKKTIKLKKRVCDKKVGGGVFVCSFTPLVFHIFFFTQT